MIEPIADLQPSELAKFDDVIDVRSPSEFAEDRMPGAINLPVLNDAERAEVGTIYTRKSRFLARRVGAAIVARNVAAHLDGPLAEKSSNYRPLLYCWRGGMRSGAMATILSQIGWRVGVVKGGYKTWRRSVVDGLRREDAPLNLVLLDGQTGAAKSLILERLGALGVQTLDLERLAAHRGSVFGALGEPQPPQKLFESALWERLRTCDSAGSIVVEAESSRIGALVLPRRLWRSMLTAPRIIVRAPLEARVAFTLNTYADVAARPEQLVSALARLAPFHPKSEIEEWRELAEAGDLKPLARHLIAVHYDPLYDRARKRSAAAILSEIRVPTLDDDAIDGAADEIRALLASQ